MAPPPAGRPWRVLGFGVQQEAIRNMATVAGAWDGRVVVRAVGVVKAAAIAVIADDDDFDGDGPRITPPGTLKGWRHVMTHGWTSR